MLVLRGGQRDIQTVAVTGGAPVFVTNDAAVDLTPEWNADGTQLYFASNRGGVLSIWRIRIDESSGMTQGAPELVVAGGESQLDTPRLAHTVPRLVYRAHSAINNPGVADLDAVSARVTNARALMNRSIDLIVSSVSPDGRLLALAPQTFPSDIWVVDTSGRNLRQLTNDPARDLQPNFTADGRLVFYSSRLGVYQAFRINVDGSGLEQLTASRTNVIYPHLLQDGSGILAGADSGSVATILSPPWPASEVKRIRIAEADSMVISPTSLSPNERMFAAQLRRTGDTWANRIAIFDRTGRLVRRLDASLTNWWPGWLPDNNTLLTSGDDGRLALVNIATGAVRPVTGETQRAGLQAGIVVSPDGKRVYFSFHRVEANIWMSEVAVKP